MFALLRRYLRRVDALYLALCAACSAVSVVVLVSIGQTQLGSNNKASVQLIASLLGVMLAFIFSTVDYRALARAWPLHATVAWGLVLPTLFLHNFRAGVVTIGYDAGRDLQLQLVSGGRHDLPACRAGKDQLYLNAGAAFKPGAGPGESTQKPAAFAFAHRRAYGAHPYPGR